MAKMTPQKGPKRYAIGVTYSGRDLFDIPISRLQEMDCAFHRKYWYEYDIGAVEVPEHFAIRGNLFNLIGDVFLPVQRSNRSTARSSCS